MPPLHLNSTYLTQNRKNLLPASGVKSIEPQQTCPFVRENVTGKHVVTAAIGPTIYSQKILQFLSSPVMGRYLTNR